MDLSLILGSPSEEHPRDVSVRDGTRSHPRQASPSLPSVEQTTFGQKWSVQSRNCDYCRDRAKRMKGTYQILGEKCDRRSSGCSVCSAHNKPCSYTAQPTVGHRRDRYAPPTALTWNGAIYGQLPPAGPLILAFNSEMASPFGARGPEDAETLRTGGLQYTTPSVVLPECTDEGQFSHAAATGVTTLEGLASARSTASQHADDSRGEACAANQSSHPPSDVFGPVPVARSVSKPNGFEMLID
jgi:hypothetical protein